MALYMVFTQIDFTRRSMLSCPIELACKEAKAQSAAVFLGRAMERNGTDIHTYVCEALDEKDAATRAQKDVMDLLRSIGRTIEKNGKPQ